MTRATLAVFMMGAAGQAASMELLLGVGADDVFRSDATVAFAAEVRTAPLAEAWGFEVLAGVAGEIDGDRDFWIGAGPVVLYALPMGFRLEASVMPGFYNEGDGNDLGGNFQIRTEAGVSLAVTDNLRIGFSLSHKSNASLRDDNPGLETALVKAIYAF